MKAGYPLLKSGVGRGPTLPHESIHAQRFKSQLLDHFPGNTPKVSNFSRNSQLSGQLRDQPNGNYYTHLQMTFILFA